MNETIPVIDRLDQEIIKLLQGDGRMPTVAIGRTLGVSETTVRKRIERLLDRGIIHIGARVEPLPLHYTTVAIIGLEVELPHIKEVAETLAAMPEVRYCALSTGQYDVIIEVVLRSDQELLDFLMHRVSSVPHIQRSETSLTPHIMKAADEFWFPYGDNEARIAPDEAARNGSTPGRNRGRERRAGS